MKKSILLSFLVAALALPVMANGQSEGGAASGGTTRLTFGTGSSGGNFYVVGAGLANTINNLFPDKFIVTAEETGGGTANLSMIEAGEADFGITMASSLAQGLDGTAAWLKDGKKMENVRGLIPLYPSYLTIYALESSPIKTLADFKDRTVGFGSKGAAMDNIFREMLPKMGYAPKEVFNDSHAATATAVSQGQIDAALLFSLPPFPAIAELEASKNLRFIGLTQEEQDFMLKEHDFYTPADMPVGAYKGVKESYKTVTEWNLAVVSAKVPEDVVYTIVKGLFEHNDQLVQVYKGLTYAKPENCKAFNVKLHPGVVKYLDEIGVSVPAELR